MLNIINHEGNANQNRNEVTPHAHYDDYYKKVLIRMWRTWNPCALLAAIKNGTTTMEKNMVIPQKPKNRITI